MAECVYRGGKKQCGAQTEDPLDPGRFIVFDIINIKGKARPCQKKIFGSRAGGKGIGQPIAEVGFCKGNVVDITTSFDINIADDGNSGNDQQMIPSKLFCCLDCKFLIFGKAPFFIRPDQQ